MKVKWNLQMLFKLSEREWQMNNEKKLIKQIKNKSSRKAANELIANYYKEIYAYYNEKIWCCKCI